MNSVRNLPKKLVLTGAYVLLSYLALGGGGKSKVLEALRKLPQVSDVVSLPDVEEGYAFYFEQRCDPFDPASAVFKQRAYLYHRDFDRPVVVELEGYDSEGDYPNELAEILQANRLIIEHRYFGKSVPASGIPWTTLTIRNAAEDHHQLITAIKSALYTNTIWISTGISKGGQTTLIHRSFYPEDVDASVCYVAPLNFEREDPRIHAFLNAVGTPEQREKVRQVQLLCLERKNELLRELEIKMKEKRWSWAFPPEVALEYYILEYSFAFWQWGGASFEELPDESTSARDALSHVLNVSGVSFFENSGVQSLRSYFYTAMTEEGIYDYDTTGFSHLLSRDTYNFEFSLPSGFESTSFDPEKMQKVNAFLQQDARKFLFIYGEVDPWSATGVNLPVDADAKELYKFVRKGGNHATRIFTFEETERTRMLEILHHWISEK